MNFFIKKLGISTIEFNKLFLLILHSFFSAIFVSIFFSVANAEFVNNFGSEFLPVGYLLSGIVGYLTVQGYGRLLKKSGYSAFFGGLASLLVLTLVFRCTLYFTNPEGTKWLSFVIFLFAMPFLAISGLEQSGLILKMYDIREGKRYAGIVSSGGTVSSIVGYLSIPLLIPFLKSRYDLFFIAIGGLVVAIFFLFKIYKAVHLEEQKATVKRSVVKSDISLMSLLRQKYIRYIALCGGISMMAFYFVDYSFLINAKAQSRSPESLTAVIAGFFAFIKSAELILSLLSGRIFRSFGLKAGIIVLPAICVFVTICAIIVHSISEAGAFIFTIFSLKFLERIVSKAIEEPTYKNLYQLLDANDRLAIQAKIDGGTKQIFIILGGLILLLYSQLMPHEYLKIGLLYISFPIFLVWLYSAKQLVNSFKEKLRDLLNPENLNKNEDDVSALAKLRAMFSDAQSDGTGSVILNLLSYKMKWPAEQRIAVARPKKFEIYDLNVWEPLWTNVLPLTEHSMLEFQLCQPLLVIPPKEALTESIELRKTEYLDEKEIFHLALSASQPNASTIKDLGKKLDDLKQDHEKKLVLSILEKSTEPLSFEILLNHLDYPDYFIGTHVFKTLENKNFKCTQKEDVFYRTALESTLTDLTYIISALSAIPNTQEFFDLINALLEEESLLKNRLLSILTWKYDKTSIRVIRENIVSGNSEYKNTNNILALELIDNLLESEIKSRVMTVFESGSYLRRLSALNKWYNFSSLTIQETLTGLLYYNYTKIGTWTKACALKIMLQDKNKEYKKIIAGFSYHPNSLLCALANEYTEIINGNTIYPFLKKEEGFSSSDFKNKASNLKGTEMYNCIKLLKTNIFFKKTSFNALIKFSSAIELKNYSGAQELAGIGNPKNKPFFIFSGNVILEFNRNCPHAVFSKHYIIPSMFNDSDLSKVLARSQTSLYEFSPMHLVELIFTSDAILNEVMSNEN
jgi:ATP:ADP antiporter, AAA family